MLFNSHTFLLAFLPAMLLLYVFADHRWGRRQGILVLVLGSLFFYGWWRAPNVLLILFSIVFNFFLGRRLAGPAPWAGARLLMAFPPPRIQNPCRREPPGKEHDLPSRLSAQKGFAIY